MAIQWQVSEKNQGKLYIIGFLYSNDYCIILSYITYFYNKKIIWVLIILKLYENK